MSTYPLKRTRSLGIDYGIARIGVAYSDESKIIASPMALIKTERKSEETLKKLLAFIKQHQIELNYEIDVIIVGMPLMMSGKSGMMADEVKEFIVNLRASLPETKILDWDERLSSVQADRSMIEAKFSRKKRAKYMDTVSAVIILQNYLDYNQFQKQMPPLPPIA